jgi:hypothetical protein
MNNINIPCRRRPLNTYLSAQQLKNNIYPPMPGDIYPINNEIIYFDKEGLKTASQSNHIVGSNDYSNLSQSHNIDNKLVPVKPEKIVSENYPHTVKKSKRKKK